MKKYLYLFLLGIFLLTSCSNNSENKNESNGNKKIEEAESTIREGSSGSGKTDVISVGTADENYEVSQNSKDSKSSKDSKVNLNYIKNLWSENRNKKSVVFDTEISIPEDWLALDSTSGSFYTDGKRVVFIYMDVADGMNDIPVELNIDKNIDNFCKEADKHFIESLDLFTRGEFSGDLKVNFPRDNEKIDDGQYKSSSEEDSKSEQYKSGSEEDADSEQYKSGSENNKNESKNGNKNIKIIKSDFGEYYLREGILSDDENEYLTNSAFINTYEKGKGRPFVMYIYSNDDRATYLFESIISDVFNEISRQNR